MIDVVAVRPGQNLPFRLCSPEIESLDESLFSGAKKTSPGKARGEGREDPCRVIRGAVVDAHDLEGDISLA